MKLRRGQPSRVQGQQQWYKNLFWQRPQDAEAHWDKAISPKLSKDQKVLLAEQFFGYIWSQYGPKEALIQTAMDTTQQLRLAEARFDKGCYLWSQQLFESALVEIQKSKEIQMSLGSWCSKDMEFQVHYATGMIYFGLEEYDKALCEFRQAWRISGLKDHSQEDTKSSQHMIGIVLSKQRWGIMEIHREMRILNQAILHEKAGDMLDGVTGDLGLAIYEYRQSLMEYQTHQDQPLVKDTCVEQAAIRCKIASILERQDNKRGLAEAEWTTALSLYHSAFGSQHPKTIETMTRLTKNHNLVQAINRVNTW